MVLIYLIPKNIKIKKEIFKGFGILEILAMAISFGVGFFFQSFANDYRLKVFLFISFPITMFLLLLPLPNGSTPLIIFKKFLIYKRNRYVLEFA